MVDHLRLVRDPWSLADHALPGARFVTPEEYLAGIPDPVRHSMTNDVVTQALAAAADPDGVLLDFNQPRFFATHIAAVLNDELGDDAGDDEPTPIVYDRFTAIVLTDCISTLAVEHGLLAIRGNGDSVDYRLTLRQ